MMKQNNNVNKHNKVKNLMLFFETFDFLTFQTLSEIECFRPKHSTENESSGDIYDNDHWLFQLFRDAMMQMK